ncbi:DUF1572 family protein [Flavobacterium nackdongense]|uniref:DUF1572 domain-containing protein n=1 Tax=Flavobacterium nackdongense TaxID=2547394 RepID=A0A4P6YFS8_9FLAO|nr:DUF1572 family protein [Flavobacterium nackdongense]QBN19293.1 DUF1572 domain-containing protein [Flavobacterium nackdongense]
MLIETLKSIFNRDLLRLKSEINLYKDESNLWIVEDNIANSAGNLCLHLIGNLNTYIGAAFGKTNYIRNRELEFSLKNRSKKELIDQIDSTILTVEMSLNTITEEQLINEHEILVFDKKTTLEFLLVHLTTHLTYHLGQINYHRRLLDK